ncbi:helix-turn-helix transcriptional regulator, partial [Neisseria gonorrhoeae]
MVAAPRTSLQAVGEEESSKRRQILDGARKVFLELGFDGASMGEIARAAA